VLLGVEAQPWKWLKIQAQGGPDFRSYEPDTASHASPLNSHHPVTYYGESLVSASLTSKDTLTFKYKQWQFVSSCGKVPYFDSSYDLSCVHKFNAQWSVDAGAKVLGADYTCGNLGASSLRNDYDFAFAVGAHYALNSHVNFDLGYNADLGRNEQDNIANAQTRNFDRHMVTLGALLKF